MLVSREYKNHTGFKTFSPYENLGGRSLKEQYNIIFNILEKHNPEWCFKLLSIESLEDELIEFHHVLWEMPFYKTLVKINTTHYFYKREDVFCRIIDTSILRKIELFSIEVFTINSILFREPKIIKQKLSLRRDSFETVFEKILSSNKKDIHKLPKKIRKKISDFII